MSSNAKPERFWRRRVTPNSIVARATLAIVSLAVIVGLVFAISAAWLVHGHERSRSEARLQELLSTVESTVSIACFVKDAALAKEVSRGLLSNQIVAGVRIAADNTVLYEQFAQGFKPTRIDGTMAKSRKIYSPFKKSEIVGEIVLYGSQTQISSAAWSYTVFICLILGLEVALVAAGVAGVVFNLITRPIKAISDELHRVELRTGMRLHVPSRNQRDEIGRLVSDVNVLIARLTTVLDDERRLRMERELSERKLQLIFDKAETGIFLIDSLGILQSWNPAFARTLALDDGSAKEKTLQVQTLFAPHGALFERLLEESLASGEPRECDFKMGAGVRGESMWVELLLHPIDENQVQGIVNDITERKRAEAAAERLAATDALTGLLNRRGLDLTLNTLFEELGRRDLGGSVAVLLIDLDLFKQVNDKHGHEAGDAVLRCVADRLKSAVRHSDIVSRLGGDEFVVVLPGILAEKANAIAQAIVAELGKPIALEAGLQVQVGASIGLALSTISNDTPSSVLRRADLAMFLAKQAGGCTVRVAPAQGGAPSPSHSSAMTASTLAAQN